MVGGGKTTVSRLAARFWDINKGRITIGGMNVSKIDPEALICGGNTYQHMDVVWTCLCFYYFHPFLCAQFS